MDHQYQNFENLSNELIFIIFDYLPCLSIIDAFQQLNFRFQSLLYSYQQYSFDISNMRDAYKYHSIQQFPINISQIKSLRLRSIDYSRLHIDQYLSKYPLTMHYFTLEKLSFTGDDSNPLQSFISLLPNFQRLKYLSLSLRRYTKFPMSNESSNLFRCIILFKIPTLKYFQWNIEHSFFNGKEMILSDVKSTIEHYEFHLLCFDDLNWLNLYTRNIKSISIQNFDFNFNQIYKKNFETITCLKFYNISRFDSFRVLFEQLIYLTQLKQLDIEGELDKNDYIFGYEWENILHKYLPQLKTFRFFFYIDEKLIPKPYDNFIKSFKSDFWLKEKKWFINSDYLSGYRLFLYTLPCMKNELIYLLPYERTSTTINSAINISRLHIDTITTKLLSSQRHFNSVQSFSVHQIDKEVTYEQLNKFLNLSSIQQLIIIGVIHPILFFDILQYHPSQLSIRLSYFYFSHILKTARRSSPICLQKLKSLIQLDSRGWLPSTVSLYADYSKLNEFSFYGNISLEILKQFIDIFKHLSLIKIHFGGESWNAPPLHEQAGLTYLKSLLDLAETDEILDKKEKKLDYFKTIETSFSYNGL